MIAFLFEVLISASCNDNVARRSLVTCQYGRGDKMEHHSLIDEQGDISERQLS